MSTLSSAGVGSGLDVSGIVTSLMSIESQPLTRLETKQSEAKVQISSWGTLKGKISALQDAASSLADKFTFGKFNASSSDEEVATASVSTGYTAESHEIEVISLAEKQRMSSGVFADADAAVGQGTYSFTVDGETFDVTVDANSDSLTGLRDAINSAEGNSGVAATILNVDGGSRLILTAKNSGTAGVITAPGMFTETQAAKDALLKVDGFDVTASSNTVTDVIPGMTLTLKGEGIVDIETTADTAGMTELMNTFVAAYNDLMTNIDTQRAGKLGSDSMMLSIEGALRTQFFSSQTIGDATMNVFDMGLTFDKEGVLSLNSTKFTDAMTENSDLVRSFFTNEDSGFGDLVDKSLDRFTATDGLISLRTDSLNDRVSSLDGDIERMNYRLTSIEARYYAQFSSLDTLMSNLSSTSEYLSSQLSSISQMTIANS